MYCSMIEISAKYVYYAIWKIILILVKLEISLFQKKDAKIHKNKSLLRRKLPKLDTIFFEKGIIPYGTVRARMDHPPSISYFDFCLVINSRGWFI